MILETLFETSSGSVALIDFMAAEKHSIVRIVEGRSGSVEMQLDLSLRFEYGSAVPWVTRLNHGSGILAVVGPDQVVLKSDIKLHGRGMTTRSVVHRRGRPADPLRADPCGVAPSRAHPAGRR